MSELNPNHPVTAALRNQWHAIAALLMHKAGATHLVITAADIAEMLNGVGECIVVQEKHDGLHLRLVSAEEGQRLARCAGGLPV